MRASALRIIGALALGMIALLGIEGLFAWRRNYLSLGPPGGIHGEFGDPGLPELFMVVLGDSTTVGVGATPEASFPWLVAERLGERFHVRLLVLGVSGARVADLLRDQVPRAVRARPDLALIEIGANDSTHVTPMRRVKADFDRALSELDAAGIQPVVAGVPNMGMSPAFPQPLRWLSGYQGRRVEGAVAEVARRHSAAYIPLAAQSTAEFARHPHGYYSRDMFHPGAGGYRVWAGIIAPGVERAAIKAVAARSATARS